MRRSLAALLMILFSLPLIAPACASSLDDAQLPACCRRGGKHHCAMMMEMGYVPSRFHVVSEKCPYAPFSHPLMLPRLAAAVAGPAMGFYASGPQAMVREAEAGHRISADRARHKRGPPAQPAL